MGIITSAESMRRRRFGTNKPVPRRPSWTPNKTRVSGQVTERVRILTFPIKCPFRGGSAPSFGRKELGYSVPRLTFGHRRAGTRCPGGKGYHRRLRIRKLQSQQHSHVTALECAVNKLHLVEGGVVSNSRTEYKLAGIDIDRKTKLGGGGSPNVALLSGYPGSGHDPVRRINLVPPSHQKGSPTHGRRRLIGRMPPWRAQGQGIQGFGPHTPSLDRRQRHASMHANPRPFL